MVINMTFNGILFNFLFLYCLFDSFFDIQFLSRFFRGVLQPLKPQHQCSLGVPAGGLTLTFNGILFYLFLFDSFFDIQFLSRFFRGVLQPLKPQHQCSLGSPTVQ